MIKFALQCTDWKWKDMYIADIAPPVQTGFPPWIEWAKKPHEAKRFDTFEDAEEYHILHQFSNFIVIVKVYDIDQNAYERAMRGI